MKTLFIFFYLLLSLHLMNANATATRPPDAKVPKPGNVIRRMYDYWILKDSQFTHENYPHTAFYKRKKGNPFADSGPAGYAMEGDLTTTGGKGGQTVIVKSLAELKEAAKSRGRLIIKVSGRYYGSGMIYVTSDKTIIGLPGATLNGIGLALYRAHNIIIKNMRINKVVGADCITIKELSHHVWVDHCELWGDRDHGWDYYDELLEVTDRSSYVTVSNTIFRDHHTGILIGGHDLAKADIGYLKVTVYGNYFYNISERAPALRLGYVHVFNNYFVNNSGYRSGYAIGCTTGGTVRTDNNYFKNQVIPIFTDFNQGPGTVSGASTNLYVNCGSNRISTPPSRWLPPYRYSSILISAAKVPAAVLREAGTIR